MARIALFVRDYDEAIAFYVDVLNFDLVADEYQPEQGTCWVVVRPKGDGAAGLVLTRASNYHQAELIGDQAGGCVFLFLPADDFWRDYLWYRECGVEFVQDPVAQIYGTVAVFKDLYGTLWDLVEFAD
ncbi:MAG: VOC family protein [Amylibacter sp.]|nr:VOC family protein [Amylibacter sp.]MDG1999803.1 VOC family protein [Amylibacter sp.]